MVGKKIYFLRIKEDFRVGKFYPLFYLIYQQVESLGKVDSLGPQLSSHLSHFASCFSDTSAPPQRSWEMETTNWCSIAAVSLPSPSLSFQCPCTPFLHSHLKFKMAPAPGGTTITMICPGKLPATDVDTPNRAVPAGRMAISCSQTKSSDLPLPPLPAPAPPSGSSPVTRYSLLLHQWPRPLWDLLFPLGPSLPAQALPLSLPPPLPLVTPPLAAMPLPVPTPPEVSMMVTGREPSLLPAAHITGSCWSTRDTAPLPAIRRRRAVSHPTVTPSQMATGQRCANRLPGRETGSWQET